MNPLLDLFPQYGNVLSNNYYEDLFIKDNIEKTKIL